MRNHVIVRILEDSSVKGQDVQQVELLALVLVKSLDLNIEDGVCGDVNAGLDLDDLDELLLVAALDVHELLLEGRIISELDSAPGQVQVARPVLANGLGVESGELAVAAEEPAAGSNAVGDVAELLRPNLCVLGEEVFLDELGVDLGDAVDLVGADNAEIAHADLLDLAFLDEGELCLDGIVARPLSVNGVLEEPAVDLVDDLEVAGKNALEQVYRPSLECLRQEGVVGVGEYAVADIPGLVPLESFLIDEDSHQFGDGDGRMGIVQLYGNLVGELAEVIAVCALVAAENVAYGACAEEILLDETEGLSCLGGIVRIQNVGDDLGTCLLGLCVNIGAGIERIPVEELGCPGLPETENVYGLAVVADDRDIPRHSLDNL